MTMTRKCKEEEEECGVWRAEDNDRTSARVAYSHWVLWGFALSPGDVPGVWGV